MNKARQTPPPPLIQEFLALPIHAFFNCFEVACNFAMYCASNVCAYFMISALTGLCKKTLRKDHEYEKVP